MSLICQHLMLSVFVIVAFLRGSPWRLCVVLIFISLLTQDVKYFFSYIYCDA